MIPTQMLHYSFKLLINKITKSIAFTTRRSIN